MPSDSGDTNGGVRLVRGVGRLDGDHTVEATVEDVARMVYNTPTYPYGYKLAAADSLNRLDPAVLRAMLLPSAAHRI